MRGLLVGVRSSLASRMSGRCPSMLCRSSGFLCRCCPSGIYKPPEIGGVYAHRKERAATETAHKVKGYNGEDKNKRRLQSDTEGYSIIRDCRAMYYSPPSPAFKGQDERRSRAALDSCRVAGLWLNIGKPS